MKKEKMLWNKDKTKSVKASKIRSFSIVRGFTTSWSTKGTWYEVLGWFNNEDYFNFGAFSTEAEARNFLEKLHKQIEGE